MAELLRDNIEAEGRRSKEGSASSSTAQNRREVPDILSWVQCLVSTLPLLCSSTQKKCSSYWRSRLQKPGVAVEMDGKHMICFNSKLPTIPVLIGQRSILHYTRSTFWPIKMGGVRRAKTAWRQTTWRPNNPSADCSKINTSLYTVNFLANQNGRGKTCQNCLETDHLSTECALAPARANPSLIYSSIVTCVRSPI